MLHADTDQRKSWLAWATSSVSSFLYSSPHGTSATAVKSSLPPPPSESDLQELYALMEDTEGEVLGAVNGQKSKVLMSAELQVRPANSRNTVPTVQLAWRE